MTEWGGAVVKRILEQGMYIQTSFVRFIVAISLAVGASTATAAQVWVTDLTVKEFSFFWHNGNSVVSVTVNEPVMTGCPKGDQGRLFAHWSTGPSSAFQQNLLSSIVTAQAQRKRIAIQYETTMCGPDLGAHMQGVRVQP